MCGEVSSAGQHVGPLVGTQKCSRPRATLQTVADGPRAVGQVLFPRSREIACLPRNETDSSSSVSRKLHPPLSHAEEALSENRRRAPWRVFAKRKGVKQCYSFRTVVFQLNCSTGRNLAFSTSGQQFTGEEACEETAVCARIKMSDETDGGSGPFLPGMEGFRIRGTN